MSQRLNLPVLGDPLIRESTLSESVETSDSANKIMTEEVLEDQLSDEKSYRSKLKKITKLIGSELKERPEIVV